MEPEDDLLILKLATGDVVIELLPDVAPLHVERVLELARTDQYDNVAFHRVLEGFVAQAGDVEFGDVATGYDLDRVGTGGSDLPNLVAEFSDLPFERGAIGMARAGDPLAQFGFPEREEFLNSANSQFFIMFEDGEFLNGNYTLFAHVREGMEHVDALTRGTPPSGLVAEPDVILDVLTARSDAFEWSSVEEAQTIALLYEAGLGRAAGVIGLNFWIDRFEDGASLRQISQSFLDSAEFEARVGDAETLSDDDFITGLFRNVIGRDPAEAGLDFWTGRLEAGATRAETLLAFATVPENAAQSPDVATMTQIGFLDDPDDRLVEDIAPEWYFSA